MRARATIAELGARFIRHGALVLTHGHSRVVLALLRRAVAQARAPATPGPACHSQPDALHQDKHGVSCETCLLHWGFAEWMRHAGALGRREGDS